MRVQLGLRRARSRRVPAQPARRSWSPMPGSGHGRGVALLPSLAAAPQLESGELVQLELVGARLAPVHIEARWRTGLAQPTR
jgi:hypothetical protein